ncbi:hypothetical protein P4O66_000720 [Electrophorus voltai]|uniref:Uncharacterized protein n=1 Tax=Electrophorus voltai TaxID=2609070 RepID=A0AAD9E0J6_9TELE|nr:hypothetical protein P4O66_000720 [Electrophorus voltai]
MSGDWEEDLCKKALVLVEELCFRSGGYSHSASCQEFSYMMRGRNGQVDTESPEPHGTHRPGRGNHTHPWNMAATFFIHGASSRPRNTEPAPSCEWGHGRDQEGFGSDSSPSGSARVSASSLFGRGGGTGLLACGGGGVNIPGRHWGLRDIPTHAESSRAERASNALWGTLHRHARSLFTRDSAAWERERVGYRHWGQEKEPRDILKVFLQTTIGTTSIKVDAEAPESGVELDREPSVWIGELRNLCG